MALLRVCAGIEIMEVGDEMVIYSQASSEYYGIEGVAKKIIGVILSREVGVSRADLIEVIACGCPLTVEEIDCVEDGVRRLIEVGAIYEK